MDFGVLFFPRTLQAFDMRQALVAKERRSEKNPKTIQIFTWK